MGIAIIFAVLVGVGNELAIADGSAIRTEDNRVIENPNYAK